jgi:glycosyltransferase involved in cell wall biosynthesis
VDLTLVTVTHPRRVSMLTELQQSVAAQTCMPAAHLIVWDHGLGFEETVNRAVSMVDTEWYCLVDDDDLLLPDHVETLSQNLHADIVWSWVEVTGRNWNPNSKYVPGLLQKHNYIPSNHAFRTSLFRYLGGYQKVAGWADHDLLKRAESVGASFLNVPKVTWVYRFHGDNMSA